MNSRIPHPSTPHPYPHPKQVLLESTAGDLPFWIAPIQLRLLPVSDDFRPYCEEVLAAAKAAGLRAEIDIGGRSLSKQIKVGNQEKISVLAVIGKDEVERRMLTLTSRKVGKLGTFDFEAAIANMAAAVETSVEPHEVEGVAAIDVESQPA